MKKEAFEILGLTIYWYGIFAAIAFMMAFGTGSRRAPREGLTPESIMNLAPWVVLGAIAGARLLYVISYWKEEFAGRPWWEAFQFQRAGLVFYGGLIGSSMATIIYCGKHKLPLWKVADILSPSLALGHGFGRIGCLMTGCCYGRPTDLPWAIHFPKDHWTHGVGVHPTQIYESALNFALCFGLLMLYRRKKFDGQIFAAYLVCYAVLRAFVESFRGDYAKHFVVGILTPGQTVSVGIFTAGIILWWKLGGAKTPPKAAAA